MANTITRRPLPALVSLIALLALTALVWWRVIDRDTDSATTAAPKTTAAPCTTTPSAAAPTKTLGAPGTVTVRVLNSTSRRGIAAKARTDLLAGGFKVPDPAGNDKRSGAITSTAQIRYGKAGTDGARLLRYYLPGAKLTLVKTTRSATVTVSLGDAYTKVASEQQVRAAMAAKRVAIAPATTSAGAKRPSGTGAKRPSGTATAPPSSANSSGSAAPAC